MRLNFVSRRIIVSTVVGATCFMGSGMLSEASDVEPFPTSTIERFDGTSFGDLTGYTYIRREPRRESDWVGKLYQNNMVTILSTEGTWAKIQSGSIEGYVEIQYLLNIDEALNKEQEIVNTWATVTTHALNVRRGPSTDYDIANTVTEGTRLLVVGDDENGWVMVQNGDEVCYVSGEYVTLEKEYTYAESKEEEAARIAEYEALKLAEEQALEQKTKGQEVLAYASQFLGNPYVWGGTDLIYGADCSGFVQSVYSNFGISLPRTSSQQRSAGEAVSYEEVQIGDIVCYEGHVGIYAGDGKIINAIDPSHGIGISSATYNSIITIRRVI